MSERGKNAPLKAVLVTGAAKRLGRAIALELARHGWAVAVHYNSSKTEAEATAREIAMAGARTTIFRADLAKESEAASLIPQMAASFGPLTALVNNASLFESDTIETFSSQSWQSHIAVNLHAPLLLSQAFARQVPEGSAASIVNLLDQRLLKPTPEFLSYGVSKAGLHWLTVTLAQALAPRIRVNAVAPGPTLRNARQSESHFQRQTESTILGRGATPEDVASATRYLLEAQSVRDGWVMSTSRRKFSCVVFWGSGPRHQAATPFRCLAKSMANTSAADSPRCRRSCA
jgi:NAD(P)-dependent dehydrogenase (short-subunit alcohol dehydrogenase family)